MQPRDCGEFSFEARGIGKIILLYLVGFHKQNVKSGSAVQFKLLEGQAAFDGGRVIVWTQETWSDLTVLFN